MNKMDKNLSQNIDKIWEYEQYKKNCGIYVLHPHEDPV
jgi:hypothetical protein